MAIQAGSFDRVVFYCDCFESALYRGHVTRYESGNPNWHSPSHMSAQELPLHPLRSTNADVQTVLAAVRAGTAEVWYIDGETPIAYDDLPDVYAQLHAQHPLHKEEGWRYKAVFVKQANVETNAQTGRMDLQTMCGVVPMERTPGGSGHAIDLRDWEVRLAGSNHFELYLPLPVGSMIALTNVGALPIVRGMVGYLHSLRTGSPEALDYTTIVSMDQVRAAFNHTFAESDASFAFSFASSFYSGPVDNLVAIGFQFVRTAGGEDLPPQIPQRTFTIPSAVSREKPPFGNTEVPAKMDRITFPDGQEMREINGRLLWQGHEGDAAKTLYRIPMDHGYSRIVNWRDLAMVTGAFAPVNRIMTTRPHVHTVHFSGESTSIARGLEFPRQREFVGYPGTARETVIHNRNPNAGDLNVFVKNQADFDFRLRPDELFGLRMAYAKDGTGELVGFEVPVRVCEHQGSTGTIDGAAGSWSYGNDTIIPLESPGSAIRFDSDAFQLGAAGTDASGEFTGTSLNEHFVRGSTKMKMQGEVLYEYDFEFQALWPGSGNMPAHLLGLIHWSVARNFSRVYTLSSGGLFSGSDARRQHAGIWRQHVGIGDIMIPFVRFNTAAKTMPDNKISVVRFIRRYSLQPIIHSELAAA